MVIMHAYELNAIKQAELSSTEMTAAVPAFLAKVARFRPRIVCFVGLGIWQVVHQALSRSTVVVSSSEVSALNSPHMRKVGLQSDQACTSSTKRFRYGLLLDQWRIRCYTLMIY